MNRNLILGAFKGTTVAPTDPNFKNVAMLVHGNGANGTTNNSYSAVSAPTLSMSGALAEGTFTPYGANWSNLFDGSTGYLSSPSAASLAFGTSDFTVECWAYLNTNSGVLIDTRNGSNANGWVLWVNAGALTWYYGATSIISTGTVPTNSWVHVAVSRQGTSLRAFINGALIATTTDATSVVTSQLTIGSPTSHANNFVNGYISNLRVVNGTALYTVAFTPTTSPLTAIANTALLTCQSNRFIDNSPSAFTLTQTGSVKVQRFDPFGDNSTPYTTATYSGSCWFDGSTGYLQTGSNSAFQMSGDFTLEGWVYMPALVNCSVLGYWTFGTASSCAFMFQILNTGFLQLTYGIGAANTTITGTSAKVVAGAWNHIAVTRQGTTVRFFVNGVVDASTFTASGAFNNASQPLLIGADNNQSGFAARNFFSGYLTDIRIVNGTALYTAAFTPNTTPLTAVINTKLLYQAQFAGASGVYDNAMQGNVRTVGTVQISNAQSKFNGSSLFFSGTLSNSVYPCMAWPSGSYQLGSAPFTIEAWIYPTSASQTAQLMGPAKNGVNSDWLFYLNAGKLGFHWNNSTDLTSTGSPAANTWSHVAAVRSGNTLTLYLNGVSVGTAAMSGSVGVGTGDLFTIGADSTLAAMPYTGYMGEIRITQGYARYTANFTAPTSAFPNSISGDPQFNYVTLLVHGNGQNAYANNVAKATFASNTLALTSAGSLGEGTFTPFGNNWSSHQSSAAASYLTYGASTSAGPVNQSFCIEMWVMFETLPTTTGSAGEYVMWQKGRTGTSNFELAWGVQYTGSAYQMLAQYSNGDGLTIVSANSTNISLTPGTWHHFAITQVGGSGACTFFFDGQLLNTFTHGVTNMYVGTGAAAIGNNNVGSNPVWGGFISNVRVVFGSTVYSSSFTPSTAPLSAIAGTNFLGCQSNRWIDNSSNAWTITPNGTNAISRFNPFGDNKTPYKASTYGGSTWFAGSGSSLSYAANSAFGFGTGQFTIEAWVYVLSFDSNNGAIVDLRSSVSAQATEIAINSSGQLFYFDGPNNTVYTDPTALALNTWYHVALTRDGFGVWRMFKNGVQVATNTASDDLGSSQPILIGQSVNGTTNWINAYVSGPRITKGQALYTQTFTPPTTVPTAGQNTSFLFSATDAPVIDNAMQQTVQTLGTAQVSTAQQKFNTGSLVFDGSATCQLSVPNAEVPVWGSLSWTIEFWIYPTSNSASLGIFGQRTSSSNFAPIELTWGSAGVLQVNASTSGSAWAVSLSASTSPALNTWSHVAVVRNGSTLAIYVNGVSVGSASITGALMSSTSPFIIGGSAASYGGGGGPMVGYMQEFRGTLGLARYTANFSAPTSPFPDQ